MSWNAMFDRRSAIGALGLGAALSVQPGCAGAGNADKTERYLGPIRALLKAVEEGTFTALPAPRPVISGLDDPARLKGVRLEIVSGSYIVRPERQVVDIILPAAAKETSGAIAGARFCFVEQESKLVLRTVAFGSDEEALYVRIDAGTPPSDVQRRYDDLAARGGGTMWFAAGTHRLALTLTNRNVRIAGAGIGATVLSPADPDRPVIEAAYNSGSWTHVDIADLALVGTGVGYGFRAGHVPRQPDDEFIGRTRFQNVRFAGFAVCLARIAGQIGLWLQNCVFEGADVHIQATGTLFPGEPMHAGNMVVRDCYFAGARKAVVAIDSPVTGTGQITFDHCIMELNPGYVLHVTVINGVEGVPAILVRSCWNEANATAIEVDFAGTKRKPVYGWLNDTSLIRFDDTPLGDLMLTKATVETTDCSLDLLKSVSKDRNSTLVHRRARGFGSFAPQGLVESVAATYQFGPNRALSFEMPARRYPGVGAFTANRLITLKPGERLAMAPSTAIPAGSWAAWAFDCRRVGGAAAGFSVQGSSGLAAGRAIDHDVPRTIAGMTWCDTAVADVHFELSAGTLESHVEVGHYSIVRFDNREDALAFVNGRRAA